MWVHPQPHTQSRPQPQGVPSWGKARQNYFTRWLGDREGLGRHWVLLRKCQKSLKMHNKKEKLLSESTSEACRLWRALFAAAHRLQGFSVYRRSCRAICSPSHARIVSLTALMLAKCSEVASQCSIWPRNPHTDPVVTVKCSFCTRNPLR
jgi:hypothetical protein